MLVFDLPYVLESTGGQNYLDVAASVCSLGMAIPKWVTVLKSSQASAGCPHRCPHRSNLAGLYIDALPL